jgi:hypothetical protein
LLKRRTENFDQPRAETVSPTGSNKMPMLRIKVGNRPPFCAHQLAGLKPQAEVKSASERGVKSRM